jgi:hypothetical protein
VAVTCRSATEAEASTVIAKNLGPTRRTLVWKWKKGASTSFSELGDSTTEGGSDYTLCAFDQSGPVGSFALVAIVRAPAGGQCGRRSCWSTKTGVSVRYKDRERTPDGATKLIVTAGDPASITVKAKESNLDLPTTALVPEVRVQLRRDDDPVCWEARFRNSVRQNEPGRFKAKSDLSASAL